MQTEEIDGKFWRGIELMNGAGETARFSNARKGGEREIVRAFGLDGKKDWAK